VGTPAVNIIKKVKGDKGWQFRGVTIVNGRIKGDSDGGVFYLEWRNEGRRVRVSAGADAVEAYRQKELKEAELRAASLGLKVADAQSAEDKAKGRTSLAGTIATFLEKKQLTKSKKTYYANRTALSFFQLSCSKVYVEQVDDMDIARFKKFLSDGGATYKDAAGVERTIQPQHERSVYNKIELVLHFLGDRGVNVKTLAKKGDRKKPKSKKKPYSREDLETLFAACTEDEQVWFKFFLLTGMRENEVQHILWDEVDFSNHVVKVRPHPEMGHKLKTQESSRDIPMPDALHVLLKEWKRKADRTCGLVFPTAGCKPKLDFLDCLKRVADRAGVKRATLKRFRDTFATWQLRAGTDIETVREWMGHTDVATTALYLTPAEGQEARDRANDFAKYAGL